MKPAVTLGFPHGGKAPRVILGPEVSIREHLAKLGSEYGLGVHKEFERVEVYNLDSVRRIRLDSPEVAAKRAADASAYEKSQADKRAKAEKEEGKQHPPVIDPKLAEIRKLQLAEKEARKLAWAKATKNKKALAAQNLLPVSK